MTVPLLRTSGSCRHEDVSLNLTGQVSSLASVRISGCDGGFKCASEQGSLNLSVALSTATAKD
eukprot:1204035-Rhodomonas_salina.3